MWKILRRKAVFDGEGCIAPVVFLGHTCYIPPCTNVIKQFVRDEKRDI